MIKSRTAIIILLSILICIIIFHLSILLKVVSYEITWGGRLKNDAEMYVFEAISLLMNIFLGFVLLIKGRFVREIVPLPIVNSILWVFLVLFVLNTFGNLFAKTNFEKLFAILTAILAVLIWVVLRKRKTAES